MRSFFFQNDGIVLDRSVRSRERTIVPQERRPVLVMEGDMGGGPTSSEKRKINPPPYKFVSTPKIKSTPPKP